MRASALAALVLAGSSYAQVAVPSLPRSLLQAPDCGLAFQPCCPWGPTCEDDALTCIAREGGPRCEPCGAPFAQPCPQVPYCDEGQLIPTTRA